MFGNKLDVLLGTAAELRTICQQLAEQIDRGLPEAENRIWHRHPVWFLDGNPIVGYSKLKNCVRLLFWSGRSFQWDYRNLIRRKGQLQRLK